MQEQEAADNADAEYQSKGVQTIHRIYTPFSFF